MSNTLTPSMTAALAAIAAGHNTVEAVRDEAQLAPRATPGVIKGLVARGLVLRMEDGTLRTAEDVAAAEADHMPADFDDAIAVAAARRAAGTPLALAASGKTAKMVTVSNVCYVSTDGRWATAKTGEKDTAWTLFQLVDEGYTERGTFRTCNLAFAPENLS